MLRITTGLLLSASLALAASAQVEHIEYFKTGTYAQHSNDAPTTADFWSLTGRIITDFPDDLTQATIGALEIQMGGDMTQYDTQWLWYSQGFDSQEELDAAFPDGTTYQFDLAGPNVDDAAFVSYFTSLFCGDIPAFTGTTYDDLQEMNPNKNFTITINGFSPVPGSTYDAIFCDIYDVDHNTYPLSVVVDPSTTAITIDPGTLSSDTHYQVLIYYSSRYEIFDAYFGTADTGADYDLVTSIDFHTLRCIADLDGNPGVDLGDFFFFLNCFDATDPCADIDGVEDVDLGDFFAFFNAFDQSC